MNYIFFRIDVNENIGMGHLSRCIVLSNYIKKHYAYNIKFFLNEHESIKKIDLNQWSNLQEPSQGYGGFHFDPEIAVNQDGTLCLIWGWDSGEDAELVYAINKGDGWSKPLKVADIKWGKPGLSSIDVDSNGNFHVQRRWSMGQREEAH